MRMTKREWLRFNCHPNPLAHWSRLERLIINEYDDASRVELLVMQRKPTNLGRKRRDEDHG